MKREIQFDYYEVHAYEMDANNNVAKDVKMDIMPIFESLIRIETVKRTQEYKNDKIRFQIVHKKDDSIWEIQLLRLREVLLPGIADSEGNYEIIKLEDGQYIGESTSILYDSENCVICMQRNSRAISPSVLEYLFRAIYKGENELITLKPIVNPTSLLNLNDETLFRKIEIGVATNEIEYNKKNQTPIGKILNDMQKYDCGYISLELGFNGRLKKNTTMDSGLSFNTIKELLEDNKINKLKVDYKSTEDSFVEHADLIENKTHDIISFNYERNNDITHEIIFKKMYEKYLDRKKNDNIYR